MNNIFAGHANSYHGFDFEQTLDGISKAGFKYIELAAVLNWTEHVMSYMSDEELEQVSGGDMWDALKMWWNAQIAKNKEAEAKKSKLSKYNPGNHY